MSPRKRPRPGDIVEVPTPGGMGYAQYSRRDASLGSQIRVLPGLFAERPNVETLARRRASYSVFFSLGPAVSRGLVEVVGHGAVPDDEAGSVMAVGEIWNYALLAERMAEKWAPGGPFPTCDDASGRDEPGTSAARG